jgi:hypothetical protein
MSFNATSLGTANRTKYAIGYGNSTQMNRIYNFCNTTTNGNPIECVLGTINRTPVNPPVPANTYYIALLFTQTDYDLGIDAVFTFIKSQFPNAHIVYKRYVVDGTIQVTDNALTNFITLYPTGNRVTVSSYTSILNECSLFFTRNKLDILSLSTQSTSSTNYVLPNVLTYGYYNKYFVISSFFVITQYEMTDIVIIYDPNSTNIIFINDLRAEINVQNIALGSPYHITTVSIADLPTTLPNNSCVFLFADTSTIQASVSDITTSIGTNSYIVMSDINFEMTDIFGSIPALVPIIHPMNFTTTSNTVYNCLPDITKLDYTSSIFPFYDILYTLIYMSNNNISVNKQSYIEANPFINIPQAYSNSLLFNSSVNGFTYGQYYWMFTNNCLLNTTTLVNTYNSTNPNDGSIPILPDSQSVFKALGIVPFFATGIFYINADLNIIYDASNPPPADPEYVKYDANVSTVTNGFIAVSELQPCKFIYNKNSAGYLTYIQPIYTDIGKTAPIVDSTMSKVPTILYI